MDLIKLIDKYIGEYLGEGTENKINKVEEVIKKSGKELMSMRTPLESIFKKKDVDFVLSPIAHFRIKDGGKTLIIVNKKYADDAEKIVGNYAIGYEGKI